MQRIKWGLLAALLSITGLWVMADTFRPQPFTYFSFRGSFVQYTGVVAIALMSLAMLLALRPRWLEPKLDGLDKMYRLHKWLGLTALGFSVVHWWFAQGSKWMVRWGWLERPARGRSGEHVATGLQAWFGEQRGFAESIGEWAFYAVVVLLILALVRRFPYHWFAKTHKLLAIAFLVLVYHAVVLTRFEYWSQPVGGVLAVLMAGGVVAAALALGGRIGAGRKVRGVIDGLTYYPELRVLETSVRLDAGWPGHAAGQFAFVTSTRREGAHPYTIASAWKPEDPHVVFITKALGDHTARLREILKPGMPITVEGPYGCFSFASDAPRQIWVGAGIGITPFVARLKDLASTPGPKAIDLFHPTTDYEADAIDKLKADAAAAGVTLHVLVSARDGHLNGEQIRAAVPEWRDASVWFCGPAGFGQALRADLESAGLNKGRFHQELFQLR
ncbi:MAG: ferric reductase-like transmembrane domain-containing protein [Nevskiales bacterium]|nr:ferric reductase-like transmembrane domain-containing protein [Nevskiales bacterium]